MHGLAHRHAQNFVDAFPAILSIKHFGLEAHPLAVLADQFHIREKLHFNSYRAISLAGFAASTRHIERTVSGGESTLVCLRSSCEEVPDPVERFDVCDRIGSWSSPN